MSFRARLAAFAALAFLGLAGPSIAGEVRDYDAAVFEAAQTAGVPIVIHVTATWCPTCKAQSPIVQSLASDAAHPDLLVLEVDFDTQLDVLRKFNVRHQSTLIAFRGVDERARSVGDTNATSIAALVAATH